MTQPTISDVLTCNDEAQLNEWAAVYCMGWDMEVVQFAGGGHRYWSEPAYRTKQGKVIRIENYRPCKDKAQAFDLMIDREIVLRRITRDLYSVEAPFADVYEIHNPLIAIVKAAICSAIEDKE